MIRYRLLHLLHLAILALTLYLPNVSADAILMYITKDANTSLFSITLNHHDLDISQQEQYVMDLGGSNIWFKCPDDFNSFTGCPSYGCELARSYQSPLCPNITDPCPCTVSTVNPITKTCVLANAGSKWFSMLGTNGRNPYLSPSTFSDKPVSCAPPALFSSLPTGSSGMVGFARYPDYALPKQFSPYFFGYKNQLAICLPDTHLKPGVAFLGSGPFYLKGVQLDVTSILSNTPILNHPTNTEYHNTPMLNHPTNTDYFISVENIYVGGEPCMFPSQILEFDSLGHGGVKLSTVVPYTTFRSPIYSSFLQQFDRATGGLPRANKVHPFDLCFETNALAELQVPQIDLKLANGVNWTISPSNSMKMVSNNLACLAFVDGGDKLEEAVVIGSYQMENNFLLFDLENSNLAFSSSLLSVGIQCSDFNTTPYVPPPDVPIPNNQGWFYALDAPVTKDSKSSLYSIILNDNERYVVDLGGSFLWHNCSQSHTTFDCQSSECTQAEPYRSPQCPSLNNTSGSPCHCTVAPSNPISKTCALSDLSSKSLKLNWTDGMYPVTPMEYNNSYVSCAPSTLFKSLPIGSSGMAGFSRSPYALPTQFSPYYVKFKRQFAICLPSSDVDPGVVLFGNGPFFLGPPSEFTEQDVLWAIRNYTPLLKHPTKPDYYVNLTSVNIGGKPFPLPASTLQFDALGRGGVKLSTIAPYTILREQIFVNFIRQFGRATSGIPRSEKVKPFDLCFYTSSSSSNGFQVPQIDLELADGVKWTVPKANSMKQVRKDVACLAFVNGGKKLEEAVVIGSYQMENNFLLFDLEESRLGFFPLISGFGTVCSNFNFTINENW